MNTNKFNHYVCLYLSKDKFVKKYNHGGKDSSLTYSGKCIFEIFRKTHLETLLDIIF